MCIFYIDSLTLNSLFSGNTYFFTAPFCLNVICDVYEQTYLMNHFLFEDKN